MGKITVQEGFQVNMLTLIPYTDIFRWTTVGRCYYAHRV